MSAGARPRLIVGLTGGIASGKTAVAERLAELGALIVDSDVLAREVVAPGTPGLLAIEQRFGSAVLRTASDGRPELDRAALGALVFAEPDARLDLEAIVHPAVRSRALELTRAAPAGSIVVQVIPLLVETGQQSSFDRVVVVDVDPELQLRRWMDRNGLTREQSLARVNAQATRAQRLAAADEVVDNNGTLEHLHEAVDALWLRLRATSPAAQPRSGMV